ncbi:hypothetical protein OWR29_18320 [Actinoplanes sp. Pm04-4]|uniref:Uncharacterized protein n=1 Tax=Paractinoplanes pyxinae TaxID=2997416 RepID=A0ABT4B2X3_9ACTN|nr:hypothetical protein [Actinoplanes pyxinae]MCY1139963.1 hypothetical protein [Actinoplanes pyxinae]
MSGPEAAGAASDVARPGDGDGEAGTLGDDADADKPDETAAPPDGAAAPPVEAVDPREEDAAAGEPDRTAAAPRTVRRGEAIRAARLNTLLEAVSYPSR